MNKSEALLKHYAVMNIARDIYVRFSANNGNDLGETEIKFAFESCIKEAELIYEIQEKRQQEIMKEFEDEK